MLVDCKAYTDVHKITDFKKGKEYEVSEFLFNSFVKSGRGISLKNNNINDEELKDDENDLDTQDEVDLKDMSKKTLKQHCKKLGIIFNKTPSIEEMINKIKGVKNA